MAKKKVRSSEPEPPVAPSPEPTLNPHGDFKPVHYLFILILILVLIGALGLRISVESREYTWLGIMALMAAFAIVAGKGITGYWRGILIDARNKMSLSRLQMLSWTLVVLSTILTAAFINSAGESESAMDIEVPSQIWVLMGISAATLVASPAILSNKAKKKAMEGTEDADSASAGPLKTKGLLACNHHPNEARWGDLLKGEEVGNFDHVDLGKMQMFFFTFILVVGYSAAIATMFRNSELVTSLPSVEEGMNVLLGISHTGYLANKTVAHTQEAPAEPAN